jgi:tRNA modification GTPase
LVLTYNSGVHVMDDTIVAVSSPAGRSARGLLRLSGPDAVGVVERMAGGGGVLGGPVRVAIGVRLDLGGRFLTALATVYAGPASFTGQDVVEVCLPGNPAVLDRVLHRAIAQGARLAEPGEFTFRAFEMGKIDLTQAEGIAGMIGATNDAQLAASRVLTSGALGQRARGLVDRVSTLLALVEAGIDFTDQDDVVPIAPVRLFKELSEVRDELAKLIAGSRSWGQLDAPARVVLVGMPSAGKSTLFNRLLGRSRSVISPEPGTTRDVIQEPMTLVMDSGQPVQVMLVDVAGLDDPAGWIDRQAQEAAREAIALADLALVLMDPTQDARVQPGPDRLPAGVPWVMVRTKADVARRPLRAGEGPAGEQETAEEHLVVSAQTGEGIEALKGLLVKRLGDRGVSLTGETLVLQARHEGCLKGALSALDLAVERAGVDKTRRQLGRPELIAQACRVSLDHLGALGGVMTPDDVLGKVFSTFCIGK